MGDNELSQDDIDALFSGGGEGAPAPPEPNVKEKSPQEAGAPVAEEGPAPKTGTATAVKEPAPEPESATATAKPPEEKPVAQPVEFTQLQGKQVQPTESNIDFLLDVPLLIAVELGRTNMFIKNVLNLGVGSVVELNKLAGEPVDLLINNKLVARGEVVVINENFGVKIIDIISPEQRIRNLS